MTASRRYNFSEVDIESDSYREIQNKSTEFDYTQPKFYFFNVDSCQYHYLKNKFELNDNFYSPEINHYNV